LSSVATMISYPDYEKADKIYRMALDRNLDEEGDVTDRIRDMKKDAEKGGTIVGLTRQIKNKGLTNDWLTPCFRMVRPAGFEPAALRFVV
jgi:hypothetical protein